MLATVGAEIAKLKSAIGDWQQAMVEWRKAKGSAPVVQQVTCGRSCDVLYIFYFYPWVDDINPAGFTIDESIAIKPALPFYTIAIGMGFNNPLC